MPQHGGIVIGSVRCQVRDGTVEPDRLVVTRMLKPVLVVELKRVRVFRRFEKESIGTVGQTVEVLGRKKEVDADSLFEIIVDLFVRLVIVVFVDIDNFLDIKKIKHFALYCRPLVLAYNKLAFPHLVEVFNGRCETVRVPVKSAHWVVEPSRVFHVECVVAVDLKCHFAIDQLRKFKWRKLHFVFNLATPI